MVDVMPPAQGGSPPEAGKRLGGKIAVIHSIYKPYHRGGAEVVVENIVAGLKKKNEDIFVITLGYENKIEEIDGVKIHRIKPFNLFNFLDINSKPVWLRLPWHIIGMFNDITAWKVYKILEKEKPDLALTHNLKGLSYYIPRVLQKLKIKNIYTVHDAQLLHPSGLINAKSELGFVAKIYCWVCKQLFGSPDVVIFPSKYFREVYEKFGFFKLSKKESLANPLSCQNLALAGHDNSEAVNLLYLGQIEEYKGVFDLLEAFQRAIVGSKMPVFLHFVGDGHVLAKAKEKAKNDRKVIFWGRMDHEEMEQEIWSRIDLLINPSKVPESFGMVLIEANAKGIPVLATNVGALPEIIEEGKNGWLIESGNVVKLKEKIESILKDKGKLASMRKDCVDASKKYNVEEYIEKLLNF